MAVQTNTITTADINFAIEKDFVARYEKSMRRLLQILGMFGVETAKAGQVMRTLTVTGQLNNDALSREEGDIVPLSKYQLATAQMDTIGIVAHRKLTTGEAILASTYEKAVMKTDKKFGEDALQWQFDGFMDWLVPGTDTVTAHTLQGALALVDDKIADVAETNGFTYDNVVHFVPRQYVTDYLANADLTLTGGQMLFGMRYLEDFLGVSNVFVTNKVQKIVATPTANVRIFGVDFGELAKGELTYTVGDLGLIGIAHEPAKDRVSTQTHLLMPKNNFFAEVVDFVVSGTVSD